MKQEYLTKFMLFRTVNIRVKNDKGHRSRVSVFNTKVNTTIRADR